MRHNSHVKQLSRMIRASEPFLASIHDTKIRRCCRRSAEKYAAASSEDHPIGREMMAGRADAEANMRWRNATVIDNRAVSADGDSRLITISIEDPITVLEGLSMRSRQAEPRWIDSYEVPGQFVAVRVGAGPSGGDVSQSPPTAVGDAGTSAVTPLPTTSATSAQSTSADHTPDRPTGASAAAGSVDAGAAYEDGGAERSVGSGGSGSGGGGSGSGGRGNMAEALVPIASSPLGSRAESALLDASIIEVLVEQNGGASGSSNGAGSVLTDLGPGSQLRVSEVLGRGYTSLLNTVVALTSALEDSRALIMIGAGARGLGPLRAALEWAPVQAAATQRAVSLFPICGSMQSAPFVSDWDTWRQNGVLVKPIYLGDIDSSFNSEQTSTALSDAVEEAVFAGGNLSVALNDTPPQQAAVLIGGVSGELLATLSRRLVIEGISRERVLLCEF